MEVNMDVEMEVDEPEPPVLSIPPPPPPPKDSITVSHLSRLGTLALEWQCYEQHTSCIILVSVLMCLRKTATQTFYLTL